ncbi:MAG: hypothetical protein IH886_05000, partial [Nitrospinae bacterium]|nr:hypothetical protein [Nitrospinota bacterium]
SRFNLESGKSKINEIHQPDLSGMPFLIPQKLTFLEYIKSMPKEVEKSINNSQKMYLAIRSGDLELAVKFDLYSRQNNIRLLEGGNYLINSSIASQDKSNPKYHLYKTFVHVNEVMINLGKARILEAREGFAEDELEYMTSDSYTFIRVAKLSLRTGFETISIGQDTIEIWKSKNEAVFKNFPGWLDSALKLFNESFNNEMQILQICFKLLEKFPSDEGYDAAELILQSLSKKRLDLENKRTRLVGSMSSYKIK